MSGSPWVLWGRGLWPLETVAVLGGRYSKEKTVVFVNIELSNYEGAGLWIFQAA